MAKKAIKPYWYFIALIPPLMGAINFSIAKTLVPEMSPISLSFYRWVFAFFVATPFFLKGFIREFNEIKTNWPIILLLSLSGVTCFNTLAYYSAVYTSSINLAIIANSFPMFVILLNIVILKEHPSKLQIAALLLAFFGVIIIATEGSLLEIFTKLFENFGDYLAIVTSMCWAVYSFASRYRPSKLSLPTFLYSTVLIGTALIIPLYLFDIFYLKNSLPPLTPNLFYSIAFLGTFVSLVGMTCYNLSIIKLGVTTTVLIFYLSPIFNSIISVFILHEPFYLYHLIGMGFILLGVNLPIINKFKGLSYGRISN